MKMAALYSVPVCKIIPKYINSSKFSHGIIFFLNHTSVSSNEIGCDWSFNNTYFADFCISFHFVG